MSDSQMLDPANSERRFYREPYTGFQREIWRPGDGDGDPGTGFHDRTGPPVPIQSRWRLLQSDIGKISTRNHPPRFVMLDDRAVYEVLMSDITRSKLAFNWPHDFGNAAKIRARRPHRGRPAIVEKDEEGNAKYYSTLLGKKKEIYFLTGEKDYEPVHYQYTPPAKVPAPPSKRKPQKGDMDYNPRAHGHNQHTPKNMLVKHGAASFSAKEQKPKLPGVHKYSTPASSSSTYSYLDATAYMSYQQSLEGESNPKAAKRAKKETDDCSDDFNATTVTLGLGGDALDVKSPIHRGVSKSAPPTSFTPSFPSRDDVSRNAQKLSQANAKLNQQANEIKELILALRTAQADNAQRSTAGIQDRMAELENENEALKSALQATKNKEVESMKKLEETIASDSIEPA